MPEFFQCDNPGSGLPFPVAVKFPVFSIDVDCQLLAFPVVSDYFRFFPVWWGTGNWSEPEPDYRQAGLLN